MLLSNLAANSNSVAGGSRLQPIAANPNPNPRRLVGQAKKSTSYHEAADGQKDKLL